MTKLKQPKEKIKALKEIIRTDIIEAKSKIF